MATDSPFAEAPPGRKRHRRRGRGPRPGTAAGVLVASLLGVLLVGAPLAFGAVHRPSLLVVLGLSVMLALATAWLAVKRPGVPGALAALALPLVFLFVAGAQIVPIPAGVRASLDPKGSELLALAHLGGSQPMSLDPPETYRRFAEAAAALAVTLAAFLLGGSRRLRFVVPGLVASAGLAALVIGLGHRAISEEKIYGLFPGSRGLPIGPFINPNHTAEFLELGAFAALAFALARASRDGRRIWLILAAVLAAGALSTLSRGSMLALGSGALVWFLLAPRSDEGEPFHRTRFAAAVIGLVMVIGIAIGFGAEALWGRFVESSAGSETRFGLWWDTLKVVRAHPAGIGLGAFSRVYPVYQTLPTTVWFQFPENQVVGLLIEAGIPGAALLLATCAVVLRRFARNARRDRIEASLAAGLVAVLAHNLTDFGLEMPGMLLSFCAVLGVMFGRQAVAPEEPTPRRAPTVMAAFAAVAVLASIALFGSPSTRDFDDLLRSPLPANARGLAREASRAHPTDYVYALAEARLEPSDLARVGGRLRALNRALLLCPKCSGAHIEAARDLWRLGRRQQAILEWRAVLGLEPSRLSAAVGELAGTGAAPAELLSLASEKNRHDLSRLLLAHGMIDAARQALADGTDRSSVEYHLVHAQIALQAGDLPAARAAAQQALAAAPRDPRCFLLAADVEARAKDRDKALQIVSEGLRYEPMHVELSRLRLGLLMQTERWRDTDRALDDFRQALGHTGAPMTDANLAAASIFEHRGQYQRALAEYQAAAASSPDNPGLMLAVARAAEQAGSVTVAIDNYSAVLRRVPGQAEAAAGLARIHHDKKALEVLEVLPSYRGAKDK